ncbi:X-ray repair cross-complementing protein 5 [Onychomys torridus]|uniref:X-ray repair cross-complementing protein 5 n=1 Tax=Onychomys torridus TaxID=38674 RepID=UPI00167F384C|nr:X-ray repair cross-complementing protein 5 [Onychomys torridus]
MAWSGNKAAVVLCMDVGVAMGNSFPGEESPFEQAKKVMTMFVQRQVFSESKDEIALVLFGTDSTDNALAGEDQYQNITVRRHLMLPDFDLLEDIGSKIQLGSRQADFLDALIVCMDLIQRETIGKKFGKKHIEVFTDLSSPFSQDQLDVIICNLKKSGISLQFFLPFSIGKNGETGSRGDGGLGLDHHGPSFPQKGITEQQKEGIRMVERVMMSLEGEDGLGEIYSFSESLQQLCVFKKIERRSMPWPCQLTIGPNLSIKIVAYKSIVQERVKKTWIAVDARTLKKEDIQKETVYCLNDDDETEVSKEDTIQVLDRTREMVPSSFRVGLPTSLILVQELPHRHEEGPAAKKCKTEKEESHISVSSLAEGNVTKVGSVNPVENFRVLVRQKIASFEEASLQLISRIEQFLDTNETLYFMKSMECIKAFREEAIQFSEEPRFNSFLGALREKVEMKQLNHFWEIVVQDGVTLITKDEGPGSSVTTEEATKFLAPKDKTKEDAAELEEGGDVDDLLDMI